MIMAPATQQDVKDCEEPIRAQLKMRLVSNGFASENCAEHSENNNLIDKNSVSEKDNYKDVDKDFDLAKYEAMDFKAQIRWPDLMVQITLHLVSLYGLYLMFIGRVKALTILFAFFTIYTSGLGITAGVHRLWSHRAYKANTPLRILLALLFTITGQRDIYTWALDHRVHHKYTETVADPHDVRRGFWFAHVGWLVLTPHPAVENRRKVLRETATDLLADPVVSIQKMVHVPLFGLLNMALPTWIPWYCWNEDLLCSFVISFVFRFTFTLNLAYSVNSFAHLWGNKPYDRYIKSVESPLVSLGALGEGWHNYHHVFPWDYRTSELGKLNVSTNFIDAFAKIGWAYDLKAATPSMIINRAKRTGDGTLGETEELDPFTESHSQNDTNHTASE